VAEPLFCHSKFEANVGPPSVAEGRHGSRVCRLSTTVRSGPQTARGRKVIIALTKAQMQPLITLLQRRLAEM
jgi:hypothetical protein